MEAKELAASKNRNTKIMNAQELRLGNWVSISPMYHKEDVRDIDLKMINAIQNGFEVISADNLSRASDNSLLGIEKITGKKIKNYKVDLTDKNATENIFIENPSIIGIIHFAAYKAVGESVDKPLDYYDNNLFSPEKKENQRKIKYS